MNVPTASAHPLYPVNLELKGRLCVVVGGGAVGERKVKGLLAAGAAVRVVSPEASGHLRQLAHEGAICFFARPFQSEDLQGAFLVFAATSDPEIQKAISQAAKRYACLVNMADAPELCDFQVPASIRRGDLLISVATSGASPALAAYLKTRLEEKIGGEYAVLTAILRALRARLIPMELADEDKKKLFRKIMESDILMWIREGRDDLICACLRAVCGHLLPEKDALFSWNSAKITDNAA